jgi:arylsulfatase
MRSSIVLAFLATVSTALAAEAATKPNIVLILIDDVGFSDLGCYGSEIRTPNVDRLAADGLRFTQFYNNAICHLTRASVLTGLYPRRAPGGGPLLTPRMVTLGEVLQDAGYRTVLSGKWHLGRQAPNRPIDRGFEEYYGLLDGCCNYFNPAQRDPPFEGGRIRVWGHNDQLVTQFPDDFYSTDAITDHAIGHIRKFVSAGQPFFAHVCYTAAHSPLHAKPQDIVRYKGRYDGGWDALRLERHRRQLELGVIESAWKLPPREPEAGAWQDEPNKAWQASLMEVYAAMIDSVDQNVGRILQTLSDLGVADNTVVMFLSDNGGCAEQAGGDDPTNIPGPKEHYVSCGAGWAYAQNTPLRRYKAWVHEAGISTPLIVRWPGVVKSGSMTSQPGHIIDLLPTCLEIAGKEYPTTRQDQSIEPMEGASLLPIFRGQTRTPHASLYWEWSGNRAVRQGDWKLAWDNTVNRWELYDLAADRTETNDLAGRDAQRVEQMSRDWTAWAARTGVDKTTPRPIRLKPGGQHDPG